MTGTDTGKEGARLAHRLIIRPLAGGHKNHRENRQDKDRQTDRWGGCLQAGRWAGPQAKGAGVAASLVPGSRGSWPPCPLCPASRCPSAQFPPLCSLEPWGGWDPGEAAGPQDGLLTLCGLPVSGEEPAAPLRRRPPPLRARLGHSQRPASRPRPSPEHPHRQRSWPRPSGPRQPGFPSAGPPDPGSGSAEGPRPLLVPVTTSPGPSGRQPPPALPTSCQASLPTPFSTPLPPSLPAPELVPPTLRAHPAPLPPAPGTPHSAWHLCYPEPAGSPPTCQHPSPCCPGPTPAPLAPPIPTP